MCGFFITNSNHDNKTKSRISRERISFRGPDGETEVTNFHGWYLYHSRLAIIAPKEEFNQPYFSKKGGVILFNGEILNFKELAIKYKIEDKDSDTHTLSELLDIKSFNLNEIDGFFALIRFNERGELTHCARDKFGVKPLYYYKNGKVISFSSEASALSDLHNLPYSDEALEEYKYFRSPIFQQSFFQGVNSVEPGTCLVNGKYFEPLDDFNCYTPYKNNDLLQKILTSSIDSRLISDVPVGLLFSGGVDSNLLNIYSSKELDRFTAGYLGDFDTEFTKKTGYETTLVSPTYEEFKERFRSMVQLRKEPLSVPNEVLLSFLGEAWAKKGGKVLISGEAADEFFAGYDRIYSWAANEIDFDLDIFLENYCYMPLDHISESIKAQASAFFEKYEQLETFEKVRMFFIKIHLPILFRRLDFSLMYAGIEGREPIASHQLMKHALTYNASELIQGGQGKIPLRELLSKHFGKDFAFASKVGFPIDIGMIFNSQSTASNKLLNYEIWQKINFKELGL